MFCYVNAEAIILVIVHNHRHVKTFAPSCGQGNNYSLYRSVSLLTSNIERSSFYFCVADEMNSVI
jgi:hypothetical protein